MVCSRRPKKSNASSLWKGRRPTKGFDGAPPAPSLPFVAAMDGVAAFTEPDGEMFVSTGPFPLRAFLKSSAGSPERAAVNSRGWNPRKPSATIPTLTGLHWRDGCDPCRVGRHSRRNPWVAPTAIDCDPCRGRVQTFQKRSQLSPSKSESVAGSLIS